MKNNLISKLQAAGVHVSVVAGDLKVNAPKGKLTPELLAEIKANKPLLIKLLQGSTKIPQVRPQANYPVTATQYFMWFTHQFMGGHLAYNITSTLKLTGDLNVPILEQAIRETLVRHEALRTTFKQSDEELRQYILPVDEMNFVLQKSINNNFSKRFITDEVTMEYDRAFSLEKEIPVRAKLISNAQEEHILLFVLHHIAGDGWSLQLLTKEVMLHYNSLINNQQVQLPALDIQYKDYAIWTEQNLKSKTYQDKLNYWQSIFAEEVTPLNLPTIGARPAVKTYQGQLLHHEFNANFSQVLEAYAQQKKLTPFMLLLAAINGVFYKYTGQTDITLGTTVAGRDLEQLENQVGLYSNALAIRTHFSGSMSFEELVNTQKEVVRQAFENKEYPFSKLVQQLQLPKDKSRSPLFDIMVLLQNHRNLNLNDQESLSGLTAEVYNEIERGVSQQDISFVFTEREGQMSLDVEFNTALYSESFIRSFIRHFELFMLRGLERPTQKIKDIAIVSTETQQKILHEFNQPSQPYQTADNVLQLITKNGNEYSEQIAVQFQDRTLTYLELEQRTTQFANFLIKDKNIKPGDAVAISLEPGDRVIVAMLAAMKTGGVFVPIDLNYPERRKDFIQLDSNCQLLIDAALLGEYEEKKDDFARELKEEVEASADNRAYIIYTSGSTGQPKGVPVSHRALLDYALTFKQYFKVDHRDSILQQASISFDTAIEEIFPILISGGRLVIPNEKEDFDGLLQLCEKEQISLLSTHPFLINYINTVYDDYNFNFRLLISGGDALQPSYVDELVDKIPVYNTYGPTESTVCATYHKVEKSDDSIIPIGRPIPNRQVYILEKDSVQLSPIGINGELCIAGEGISKGYLNQPELSAAKFIDNPFQANTKLYRSGDLARWMPDGRMLFLGRNDEQVKIRGHRIELKEIESVLQLLPEVEQAAVLIKEENQDKLLVAYLQAKEEELSEIRSTLSKELPSFMMPAHFVLLEEWPLTAHGKVDKKALLNFNIQLKNEATYLAPQNELEEKMAELWQKLLSQERIGVQDNFFGLGGHSLKVVQLVNRAKKELSLQIKVGDVFKYPTISSLLAHAGSASFSSIPQAPKERSYPITPAQSRLLILSQFSGGNVAYNLPNVLELKGAFDVDRFGKALQKLINRHESLRTQFQKDAAGNFRQFILTAAEVTFSFQLHDGQQKTKKEIDQLIARLFTHEFTLAKAPLLKVEIIKISEENHLLLFNLHHLVGDGWSMEILSREVVQLYNGLENRADFALPPLPIQYKDYAVWSLQKEQQSQYQRSKRFWLDQMNGELPVLELPGYAPRSTVKTYNGAIMHHVFSPPFFNHLRELNQAVGSTLFQSLVAALNAILHRYAQTEDIILGTPLAGRSHADLENQIGLFLNMLPIRTQFSGDMTFAELLRHQKEVVLKAFDHQSFPFDQLVEALSLKRDTSRSALFDVMIVLHNQQDLFSIQKMTGLNISPYSWNAKNTSQFDMNFAFQENEDELSVKVEFNTDIYGKDFIEQLLKNLENLILESAATPVMKISQLDFIEEKEKEKLIHQFNNTQLKYPADQTVLDRFKEKVKSKPHSIALVYAEQCLTYAELDDRSNQLARHLLSKGVKPKTVIALCMDRSLEMVIGILGILKCRATYLPLDVAYPLERLDYILKNSGCQLVITRKEIAHFITKEYAIINIEDEAIWQSSIKALPSMSANLPAYTIYTSGTTGKPKGVTISHKNLLNFFVGLDQRFASPEEVETWLAVTSMSFDISILEMLWTLTRGSKVVIQPDRPVALSAVGQMDFSLFYFAAQQELEGENKYDLLLRGAAFADEHDLKAIWVPERHFHAFGDQFPNPAIAAAAVAARTNTIKIRSGSVVLPLHDPVNIAEDWAMVDNLSEGRVELSIASGWHPNDFVLAPENYTQRHKVMKDGIQTLQQLWQGESIQRKNGVGEEFEFRIHPQPIQQELPIWVTAAGSVETFKYAGSIGANILTHLLGQTIDELADKIEAYRNALAENGFTRESGKVALMLHTFVSDNINEVRDTIEVPFKNYLRRSANLMRPLAKSENLDLEKDLEVIVEKGFERYYKTSGLFGTPAICLQRVKELYQVGVNEIACLVDYGIPTQTVIDHLPHLHTLKKLVQRQQAQYEFLAGRLERSWSLPQLIKDHKITHLQSTPSFIQDLLASEAGREALSQIQTLLVGGEALPVTLANRLLALRGKPVFNMYGPTETTIWSTIKKVEKKDIVNIGHPIANTQIYIVDRQRQLCPVGIIGELCIGGDGVAMGYVHREDLNQEKFIANKFDQHQTNSRLYRTGDLARWLPNGELECLGRIDNQVKVNGHRIELGEIENVLDAAPGVKSSAVAYVQNGKSKDLVAYLKVESDYEETKLQEYLKLKLPAYMLPGFFVVLDEFPMTLNGKINRKALPKTGLVKTVIRECLAPRNETDQRLLNVWQEVLSTDQIGIDEDFFELGGNSIKGLTLIHKINEVFSIELSMQEVFLNTTISSLSDVIAEKELENTAVPMANELII